MLSNKLSISWDLASDQHRTIDCTSSHCKSSTSLMRPIHKFENYFFVRGWICGLVLINSVCVCVCVWRWGGGGGVLLLDLAKCSQIYPTFSFLLLDDNLVLAFSDTKNINSQNEADICSRCYTSTLTFKK